jgi:hypothetical protein
MLATGRDVTFGERRALRVLRFAGSAVLVLFVLGAALGPRAPVTENLPGFANPVTGYELAATPAEVFGILGRPEAPGRAETVWRMERAIRVDFLFLLAYPAIYVGIGMLLAGRGAIARPGAGAVMALSAMMAVGDALENRELLLLTASTDPTAMAPALARLRPLTLLKWYAIYAASALVALPVWRERGWWRWSAPFFALAALLGLAAVGHLPAIEWSMAPLAVAWTITWVYALRS